MPVKPPTGGSTHVKVDASTSPTRPADVDIPLPDLLSRSGFDSGTSRDDSQPRAGSSRAVEADATRATRRRSLFTRPLLKLVCLRLNRRWTIT